MPYRLGLDVGTASCGLVAWSLDEQYEPLNLIYNSLDIWSEPLQPAKSGGVGQPKKAARRAARQLRRGFYRKARRLRKIAHLAALLGLDGSKIPPDLGQKIHALRAQAAEKKIALDDLLRVLLHLAKHRGPSGDWVYAHADESPKKSKQHDQATATDSGSEAENADKIHAEEKKGIVSGVRELERQIQKAAEALNKESITLGQFLDWRRRHDETVVLGRTGLYPSRRMVEYEFDMIWHTQSQFYPVLQNQGTRQRFFDALFYQRPLKSPAPMVGHCPLEPSLPRSPAAQMAAQAFRIEKQISDLRWGIGRRAQPLTSNQKEVIRDLLNTKGQVSFSAITEELEKAGCPGPIGSGLNMDRFSRETLKGNTTLATFRKLGLEAEWTALDELTQIQVINFLADLGSPDALDSENWHMNFETSQMDRLTGHKKRKQFATKLITFIDLLRKHPKFGRLTTMGFDGGRMSYSIKALKTLTSEMQRGCDEHGAIQKCYPNQSQKKMRCDTLPMPPETGNAVVDVAMRQVYRAVQRAINELHEPPGQVIVELSRDMALGIKKRREIEIKIKVNNKARRDAATAIQTHGQNVTDRNIDRYLFWEQQLHYCPYCANRIDLGDALGSATEREHILPRTLTHVGGKRSQLVLAHRSCNNEKGNRTPYQAFGHHKERWRIIEERAAQLAKNRQFGKARLLLLKDWEDEVLDDDAIKGFTDRQFHESSWIAKLTADWLKNICEQVFVSRGELTAHLRRIWKLDTVIPEVRYATGLPVLDQDGKTIFRKEFELHKTWWEGHDKRAGAIATDRKPDKRIDHRHHLVDALVISLTDQRLFRRMAENYKRERERERHGERARFSLYEKPPISDLRNLANEIVSNAIVRHKPDRHPDGPIFDQTAYGISRKTGDNGEHKLALNKPLARIAEDCKWNVEKIRKKLLEDVESDVTREAVLRAFDARIASGIDIKHIFDDPILHPEFGTPIKRVRLLANSENTAALIVHYNRHGKRLEKHYPHAGNAFLEIRVQDGKLMCAPHVAFVQEAMNERNAKAENGIRRFWKGDMVRLADGSLHLVGIIAIQGGGQLRLVPITETCTFGELKKRGLTMRTVSGDALASVEIIDV